MSNNTYQQTEANPALGCALFLLSPIILGGFCLITVAFVAAVIGYFYLITHSESVLRVFFLGCAPLAIVFGVTHLRCRNALRAAATTHEKVAEERAALLAL